MRRVSPSRPSPVTRTRVVSFGGDDGVAVDVFGVTTTRLRASEPDRTHLRSRLSRPRMVQHRRNGLHSFTQVRYERGISARAPPAASSAADDP